MLSKKKLQGPRWAHTPWSQMSKRLGNRRDCIITHEFINHTRNSWWTTIMYLLTALSSFPCDSDGKEFTCSAGDLGLIPELGRSPGEGKGYPVQYSGLENSMDCIVHGVAKSRTRMRNLHFTSKRLACFVSYWEWWERGATPTSTVQIVFYLKEISGKGKLSSILDTMLRHLC